MSHLTIGQRYVIQALYRKKITITEIAKEAGVHKSTVSRELRRNSGKRGGYCAEKAQQQSRLRQDRFTWNRKFTPRVRKTVIKYLREEQWSPEQIVGYCKKNHIEMVSVERIYQHIRSDKEQGGDLYKCLRHKLKHRKRWLNSTGSRIKDHKSIDERPERINNREEFGHFEMDLVVGKNNQGAVLTLTERVTKFFICVHLLLGKQAKGVAQSVIDDCFPINISFVLSPRITAWSLPTTS